MHLHEGTYESTLLKGDILHYCLGLINQLEENDKLISDSFYSALPGDKDFKYHSYNQEILSIGRDIK